MTRTADARVRVGRHGRVVIPADVRRHLGLKVGDTLLYQVQGESLLLEKRETVLARLKASFDDVPRDVSLVDELLAERRAEAEREEQE